MKSVLEAGGPVKDPRIDLGERLSDTYVQWSLFLSGYAPLLLIFAIRMWPKHQGYSVCSFALGAIFAVNLSVLLNRRTAPRDFGVVSVEGGASEIGAYIATYILPFLVVSDVGHYDLVAYGALVFVIGLVMTRENALHINPLLGLLRLHLSTIITEDEERFFIVHDGRLRPKTSISVIPIRGRLYYQR